MAKAGIVGAGIGGIALALRWAHRGHEVHVFDANPYPGGKLAEIQMQGYRFDAGPSLFTQPHLVLELFELFGKRPEDYFQFSRLPEICRYFWDDGTQVQTWESVEDSIQSLAQGLGENPETLRAYFKHIGENYEIVSTLFLENSLHRWNTWLNKKAWRGYANMHRLGLFQSMHQWHQSQFKNPKTVQLFDRYATYNGSNPYQSPATLSIIPHLEYHLGAYFPKGGMVAIIQSLVNLAKEQGVGFHLQERVEEILVQDGKAQGLRTGKGAYAFDLMASNSDIRPSYRKLMPRLAEPKKLLNQERSSSGLIFYWGMKGSYPELGVHNIFFSSDYAAEFQAIFKEKTLYKDPTVYLHISSKVAPEDAPASGENWFILINAPANEGQDWEALRLACAEAIKRKLSHILGKDIAQDLVCEDYLDPIRIEQRTASSGGALYGNASNNRFAAFLRHPNQRSAIQNLYWVGGSVHPGGGIPLCLSSAKIADQLSS